MTLLAMICMITELKYSFSLSNSLDDCQYAKPVKLLSGQSLPILLSMEIDG